MSWISNYETLILGEDGESPIRPTIERCLAQAKEDGVRLRIEIRTKPQGVPNSRSEHNLVADPDNTAIETVMQVIIERLNESPGETYNGEIRINFMQAGSGSNRYASFTRQVDTTGSGQQQDPSSQRFSGGPRMSRTRIPYTPSEKISPSGEDDEGSLDDNNFVNSGGDNERDPMAMLRGMPPINVNGSLVTDRMARQWLETTMGLLFRSNAQMIAMFERSTRMMEGITMRYGLPELQPRGITEVKNTSPAASEPSGLGLLPMLLNAAAQLANSSDPAEIVTKAADLAQGKPPPAGAARMAAIQGAGRLVKNLTGSSQNRRPDPEPMAYDDPDPEPDDPDEGGSGGGQTFRHEPARFDFERERDGGSEDNQAHERTADELTPEALGAGSGPTGAPDLSEMPAAEMKELFLDWLRKDPSRKQEVMAMLPDLAKEVM
jgi:hypothetical protein